MLRPDRLLCENFQCFPLLDFPLRDQGLTLIVGENQRTASARSNGAGKSGIGRLLRWVLYNELDESSTADDAVRRGESACVGELLALDEDDQTWRFRRTRKRGKPTFEIFPPGATSPMPGSKDELEAEVARLFGFDARTFRATVYFAQDETHRFASASVKDTERKDILHRVIGTERLHLAEKRCRAEVARIDDELRTVRGEAAKVDAQIAERDLEGLEAKCDAWAAARDERKAAALAEAKDALAEVARLRALEGDLGGFEDDLASVNEDIAAGEAQAKAVSEIDEALIDERQKVASARADMTASQRTLNGIVERLEELADDVCPTCDSPIEAGTAAGETKAKLAAEEAIERTALEEHKAKLAAGKVAVEKLEAKRSMARVEAERLPGLRHERDDIVEGLAEARAAAAAVVVAQKSAEAAKDRARAIAKEENPHEGGLDDVRARVEALTAERASFDVREVELQTERAHWAFWVVGFSGRGLPSYLLDGIMPELNRSANHYLGILADGDISVTFSTTTEKKKGGDADKISMSTLIEGFPDVPPSGGQRKKIELAADLALMDVAARGRDRLPLLFLDECFDGLDDIGADRVLRLLHALRSRFGSIFVITHSDDLGEEFERVVRATRDENGATVVERAA